MPCQHMKVVIFAFAVTALTATSYAGPGQRYEILRNDTKVYSAPRTGASVIMRLNKGDRVIEWRRQGSWVKIGRLGAVGKDGWVEHSTLQTEASETRIIADSQGHFVARAIVNGKPVRFLVDTGASVVVLRPEDAKKLGFRKSDLKFTQPVNTAGGRVLSAPVVLAEIRIGQLTVRNVVASVNEKNSLKVSLLGMSFLRRLRGYNVLGDRMVLRW